MSLEWNTALWGLDEENKLTGAKTKQTDVCFGLKPYRTNVSDTTNLLSVDESSYF